MQKPIEAKWGTVSSCNAVNEPAAHPPPHRRPSSALQKRPSRRHHNGGSRREGGSEPTPITRAGGRAGGRRGGTRETDCHTCWSSHHHHHLSSLSVAVDAIYGTRSAPPPHSSAHRHRGCGVQVEACGGEEGRPETTLLWRIRGENIIRLTVRPFDLLAERASHCKTFCNSPKLSKCGPVVRASEASPPRSRGKFHLT